MAIVLNNPNGLLRGRVGKKYYRIVDGVQIEGNRPESYNTPQDAASVRSRKKFSRLRLFTKAIRALPYQLELWTPLRKKLWSISNTIHHENSRFCTDTFISNRAVLVPDNGFPLSVSKTEILFDQIHVDLNPLNICSTFSPDEKFLSIGAVLYCYNASDPALLPFNFIVFTDDIADYNFNAPFRIIFRLSPSQQDITKKLNGKLLFLTVVTRNTENEIIQYSSTYAYEP